MAEAEQQSASAAVPRPRRTSAEEVAAGHASRRSRIGSMSGASAGEKRSHAKQERSGWTKRGCRLSLGDRLHRGSAGGCRSSSRRPARRGRASGRAGVSPTAISCLAASASAREAGEVVLVGGRAARLSSVGFGPAGGDEAEHVRRARSSGVGAAFAAWRRSARPRQASTNCGSFISEQGLEGRVGALAADGAGLAARGRRRWSSAGGARSASRRCRGCGGGPSRRPVSAMNLAVLLPV